MVVKRWIILLCVNCCVFVTWAACGDRKTCDECVRDSLQCKWCGEDDYNDTRCIEANETFTACDAMYIENPQSEQTASLNNNFTSGRDSATITQIRPQRYSIKLRPGQSVNFEINFKAAENYPADLYFIIDASQSMNSIQKAISDASENIYNNMRNKTKNVYIGLGSFIDKNTLPFVAKIDNGNPISSYKHLLSLTKDFKEFKSAVNDMRIGVNIDDPESGFDALAQAMTCRNEIGWRNDSRKIIIYVSDDVFHTAGDGKWAGITQPYDGQCYTKNGTYTKELEMDYPSIGIIRKLAAEKDMTIVFIVEDKVEHIYRDLTLSIRGSKLNTFRTFNIGHQGISANFGPGIDITLSEIYEEITQTITLKEHMTAIDRKFINITYSPDCTTKSPKPYLTENCKVSNGKEKSFIGTISLSNYYEKDRITVDIAIESIKERLTLDVEVINCDCAKGSETDSNDCHRNGNKTCGICECNPDRLGTKCECTKNNSTLGDNTSCKAPGSNLLCSGRGICSCGICEQCSRGFNGKFCHCSEFSCPHKCHGRGECDCGKCTNCKGPWTGDACDCSTKPCQMINGKECNGRGECKCSKCECDPIDATWDARRSQNIETCTVDKCTDCHLKQCQLLTPCALCQYNNVKYNQNENCVSCYASVIVHKNRETNDAMTCQDVPLENDIGCYTEFKYRYSENNYTIEVFVNSKHNCLESYYMYGGILLATIIVVGILTLIAWKLLSDIRDRREYERFLEQHKSDLTGPCENPIYEPACTTYRNPTFKN